MSRTDAFRAALALGFEAIEDNNREEKKLLREMWESLVHRTEQALKASGLRGYRLEYNEEQRYITITDGSHGERVQDGYDAEQYLLKQHNSKLPLFEWDPRRATYVQRPIGRRR